MEYRKRSSERLAFDSVERLERINSMRTLWRLDEVATEDLGACGAKTVGIEIEMTWPQAFPDMAKWDQLNVRPRDLPKDSEEYAQFSADYSRNEQMLLPKLKQVEALIPRVGRDAYWEFSFRPTRQVEVLKKEVDLLYDGNVLHPGVEYATHLTLAGHYSNRDAHAILYLLEQFGGTSVARLTKATGWARKGTGGFRQRYAYELVGKDAAGIEFRSLITSSAEQISATLHLAQTLGGMVTEEPEAWAAIRAQAMAEIRAQALPLREWAKPSEDPGIWEAYADSLGKSAIRISRSSLH